MAIILRGKYKNQIAKVHQWCNNWVMLSNSNFHKPFNISSVEFTPEEFRKIVFHGNNGILLDEFEADFVTCRFKRKKR